MRLLILAALLLPATLPAQIVRDSTISVTNTRAVRVAPNRATLYLTVDASAESAADAVTRANAKLGQVATALKGLGSQVQSEPGLIYTVGPSTALTGFPGMSASASSTARGAIRATVTRLADVAVVTSTAMEAGATGSSPVLFQSDSTDAVKAALVAEALQASRLQAEAIAKALGGRLGALVEVLSSGGPVEDDTRPFSLDSRFGQFGSAPEVVVRVSVTARYRLMR